MSEASHPIGDRPLHRVALAVALLVAVAGGALAVLVVLSVFGFTDLI
jgi:hypothetical protein